MRANRAIDEAARRFDVSCASVLPKDLGDWADTAEFVLGASFSGKDLKDVSVGDKARAQDRNTAIGCRQGLGTLIAKLGEQVPLSLSTPANRIVWGNRDVSVETPAGKIAARAAVITVSSNVLAAGNIKFAPDIPKRTLDAAAKLSLGSYDRIALQMPGNPLGLARDDIVIEQSNSTKTALMSANIGGVVAVLDRCRRLVRPRSLRAGREGHGGVCGGMADQNCTAARSAAAVKKSSATRWNAAPFALGAMSAAGPGGQASRKVLSEPIGCMYLAGEATHETLWGTIDGAWESGERAAEAALRRIGALRDPEPAGAAAEAAAARAGLDQLMARPKALISWSSGKDCAFALHEVMRRASSMWSAR